MNLLRQLQLTLKDLASVANQSSYHFSPHHFIKNRISKIIEFYLTPDKIRSISASYSALPHKLSKRPGAKLSKNCLGRLSQILIDDFTSALLAVAKASESQRQRFVADAGFARHLLQSHLSGWYDCCEACGEAVHLTFNLADEAISLAGEQMTSAANHRCAYQDNTADTDFILSTPSRMLVISDSLNDFLLAHSRYLADAYQRFVKDKLCKIDSSSQRGKLITAQFYAAHNLAHLYVGKGHLCVQDHTDHVELVREQRRDSMLPSPLTLNVTSLYLTMMDYSKLTSFCHHIGKHTHTVLKSINASLIEIPYRRIDIRYAVSEASADLFKLEIHPAHAVTATGRGYSLIA